MLNLWVLLPQSVVSGRETPYSLCIPEIKHLHKFMLVHKKYPHNGTGHVLNAEYTISCKKKSEN